MKEKGFIFLEILIAVSLISILFIVLLSIGVQSITLSHSIEKAAQADALIKEEMEAVRSFRDGTLWTTTGLASLTTGSNSPYYATLDNSVSPPKWIMQTGTQTVGDFTRKITFDKVSRDTSTQAIETTYNAAHDDSKTRKVTVTVTNEGKTYQAVTYLTNWQNN